MSWTFLHVLTLKLHKMTFVHYSKIELVYIPLETHVMFLLYPKLFECYAYRMREICLLEAGLLEREKPNSDLTKGKLIF